MIHATMKLVKVNVLLSKYNYFQMKLKNKKLIKMKIYHKIRANKFITAESRLKKNKLLSLQREIILWIRFYKWNLILIKN